MSKSNKKAAPKERNPFVQHLINRKGAGVHIKPFKAYRAQQKAELRKNME